MKKQNAPRLTWEPGRSLGANAALHLPTLTADYFAAGRELLDEKRELAEFHQFRITTKRFRYTLEMFQSAFGPAFGERIRKLQKVQEILGDLNDASVLQERYGKQAAKDEVLGQVLQSITIRIPELKAQFIDFWKQNLDAPGEELLWQRYLARPLGLQKPAATPARKNQ